MSFSSVADLPLRGTYAVAEHTALLNSPLVFEEHVTRVDGLGMYTRVLGQGSPVVLVHGLLGTAGGWAPTMDRLAANGRRVYAFDALGIGRSERVRGANAGLAALARRLGRWMDAEGLESADLVGTSHGGAVAMYFAATHPNRVRSLVLHAPANPFCVQSRPQIRFACTRAGRLLARRLPSSPGRLHRLALGRMYGDPSRLRPGSLKEYVESLRVPGTVEYVLDVLLRWRADMRDLAGLLGGLRGGRTLLLWGEFDRAVSLSSVQQLQTTLEAPLVVLPGLGHLPFEEDPEAFCHSMRFFLSHPWTEDTSHAAPPRLVNAGELSEAS